MFDHEIYYNFLMITGQETTATLLSFTLIQLLLHPGLLNRYILVTIVTCAFTINEYLYFLSINGMCLIIL